MKSARELCPELNYARWENFEGLIKRVQQKINSGLENGEIIPIKKPVIIGYNTTRYINDYLLCDNAEALIKDAATSYKLTKFHKNRNEAIILSLLAKWLHYHNYETEYQFKFHGFVFDLYIKDIGFIEFDEPHHIKQKRQLETDIKKDNIVKKNNLKIFRFNLLQDVVDMIILLSDSLI